MTWIARGVVVALLLLSVWSLYVTMERLLAYRKARGQSLAFARDSTPHLAKDNLEAALDVARKLPYSHVSRVTRAGLIEFMLDSTQSPLSAADQVEAARRAIERETLIAHSDLKRGVGGLATIATTAPFIGLFGTVIGIINAFRGMAMSGSGGIGAVSAGIAEALVTTALGLFVAIPAAWMFNYFSNRLERFQVEMSNASSEMVDFFIKKHGRIRAVGVAAAPAAAAVGAVGGSGAARGR
jgi:biopolymer transport protein ExbB/biopolymer transport protein TolQ